MRMQIIILLLGVKLPSYPGAYSNGAHGAPHRLFEAIQYLVYRVGNKFCPII